MSNIRRTAKGMTIGTLLLAWLALPARGEVGVYVEPSGRLSSFVFQIIIDEADPVDSAWVPYHPSGSLPTVLNGLGADNGDGEPSLIQHPWTGSPIAAWSRNTPSGFDVVVSRFDGGAWTPPQPVADSSADELDPDLVVDPSDGSVHLLYWVDDGAPRVMQREAPADLSSWSAPEQVSGPGEIACRPAGAFFDGVLHVAYELHDLGLGSVPREIMLATEGGSGFSSEVVSTTQHVEPNRPRVHGAQGRLWIEWIDGDDHMAWTRRFTSGSWQTVQTEPFESVEQREFHVRGVIRMLALN